MERQDLASCPKNIDDFLALYRHEEWSIQEFLDCLEDPKPSWNMHVPRSGVCTTDPEIPQDVPPSDSAMLEPAAARLTFQSSNVPRDLLRVEIRRHQNRKSQQRYREKLKKSVPPNAPHPRKPESHPQPSILSTDSASSCKRLHMAMLTILRSSRSAKARSSQR
jgi:hypothetical protein